MMRLGFNIHEKILGQEYSAAQKTYLATLLTRLNPSAILVMNNFDWALAYKRLIPKSIVLFRQYNKDVEGALWDNQSAKQYFTNTLNRHDPNIVLYVGNESQSYILKAEMQKAVAWWVELIGLFRDANLSLCLPNWGVGHPDLTWFTQDDKWAVMKPLIDAVKSHPGAYLGLHEYFSYRGVEIGNGRVGRHADIAKALKARGYDMPPVLLTELGCDQIDDTGKRGFKHSMSDNAYAAMLTDCQRSTWNVDYIKGGMIYSYGSVTTEWESFDISDSLVLHGSLVAANMSVGNPPSVPIPTPPPSPQPDPVPPVVLPKPSPAEITLTKVAACREAIAVHLAAINALEAELDQLLAPYHSKIA